MSALPQNKAKILARVSVRGFVSGPTLSWAVSVGLGSNTVPTFRRCLQAYHRKKKSDTELSLLMEGSSATPVTDEDYYESLKLLYITEKEQPLKVEVSQEYTSKNVLSFMEHSFLTTLGGRKHR